MHKTFNLTVVTLFPALLEAFVEFGIPRKAVELDRLRLSLVNPRDFATDVHRTVDDRPYGGGPGMVMKVEPLRAALQQARHLNQHAKVVYLTPQGPTYKQTDAEAIADAGSLILLAGRYEGVDERLLEDDIDAELSVGDFVLSGGEVAAMTVMDSVVRLLPGVLGHAESAEQDSFSADGLLDHPHYTRPEVLDGRAVPDILLSGDHEKIRQWRRAQAVTRTWYRRRDLLNGASLTAADEALVKALESSVQTLDEQKNRVD